MPRTNKKVIPQVKKNVQNPVIEKPDEVLSPFAEVIDVECSQLIKERQGKDNPYLMKFDKDKNLLLTNAFWNIVANSCLNALKNNAVHLLSLKKDGTVVGEKVETKKGFFKKLFHLGGEGDERKTG